MARIAGVDIPSDKKVKIALTYIHGIGDATAVKILRDARIDPDVRVKDLSKAKCAATYRTTSRGL